MKATSIRPMVLTLALFGCGSQNDTDTATTKAEPSNASTATGNTVAPTSSDPIVTTKPTLNYADVENSIEGGAVQPLNKDTGSFAFNVYQTLRGKTGNVLFSPVSLELAFAMTWAGAEADTAKEMAAALSIKKPAKAYHAQNGAALTSWNKHAGDKQGANKQAANKLRVVNRLFGHNGFTFEAPFLSLMRDTYKAPLEPTDFAKTEAARTKINQWVEAQTENRIHDLLPVGGIDELTRLVLVNAIYFLGEWTQPFDKSASRPDFFTLVSGEKEAVSMMGQTQVFRYAELDDIQVLELPYKGNTLAMTVLLPKSATALAALEDNLGAETFARWVAALKPRKVKVFFPKFEIDGATFDVPAVMKALGMNLAFDPNRADFTAMANPSNPDDRLYISAAFHKAFIKVDEKGSEAAAATAVVMAPRGARPTPEELPVFRADHPFVYAIRDIKSGDLLFVGRLSTPK